MTQCRQLLTANLTQNLRRLMVEEILSQGVMWRRKRTTETDNFTWDKMERKGGKLDELQIESEPWQLWQGPRCSCVRRTRAELHEKNYWICFVRAFVEIQYFFMLPSWALVQRCTDWNESDLYHSVQKMGRELDKGQIRENYAHWVLLLQVWIISTLISSQLYQKIPDENYVLCTNPFDFAMTVYCRG